MIFHYFALDIPGSDICGLKLSRMAWTQRWRKPPSRSSEMRKADAKRDHRAFANQQSTKIWSTDSDWEKQKEQKEGLLGPLARLIIFKGGLQPHEGSCGKETGQIIDLWPSPHRRLLLLLSIPSSKRNDLYMRGEVRDPCLSSLYLTDQEQE